MTFKLISFRVLFQQVVKVKGGMAAKRSRIQPVLDLNIQASDHQTIKDALGYVLPEDLSGFIRAISSVRREAFYQGIMAQKNSDRIVKLFAGELPVIAAIEDQY